MISPVYKLSFKEIYRNFKQAIKKKSFPGIIMAMPFRIIFFLLVILLSWTTIYFFCFLFKISLQDFFAPLLTYFLTLVGAALLMILGDLLLLGRATDTKWATIRSKINFFQALSIVFILFLLFSVSWSFIFILKEKFNVSLLHWDPYWSNLLNLFSTLIVAYGIVVPIGFLAGSRLKEFFVSVTEVIEKITEGDYSVNLPTLSSNSKTAFDKVAEDLNKMTDSLKKMESMRQEFVSNVSHEIQTPLTSILGFAKALQDINLPPEERARYLFIIEDEAKRLSRLSDNLLRLSSLDSKARSLQPETYALDIQLKEVILSLESIWQAKKIEVSAEIQSAQIFADKDLLYQVWSNLFSNALQFTPEKGQIKVSLTHFPEEILIKIQDSGAGIAAADLPLIFDRFFKADRSHQRSKKGNGLGLSIVKRILELHLGTITAESRGLEKGSCFMVKLPCLTSESFKL